MALRRQGHGGTGGIRHQKRLTHQQKEQLAAAPDTLAELLPEVGEWGVSAKK